MEFIRRKTEAALFFVIITIAGLISPDRALAIPPPELVRYGSIIAQVFAFFFIFFSTAFFVVRKKIGEFLSKMRMHGKIMFAIAVFAGFIVVAGGVSYYIARMKAHELRDIMLQQEADIMDGVFVDEGILVAAGMEFDIADESLKIEPEAAAKLIGNPNYVLIDIREPVEYETRHVPGFKNIRVGDFLAGEEYKKIDRKKTVILLCEAGERGSTAAVFLKVKGYDARFVYYGIRAWREKKLKFVGKDKLFMPDFKNKNTVLKYDEAIEMQKSGKIVIVDIRSKREFQKGHLEGAVNIPFMSLPTKELEKALSSLPRDRTVVGVSYDRFGKFYCKVLGYMVNKRDYKYGGTYIISNKKPNI